MSERAKPNGLGGAGDRTGNHLHREAEMDWLLLLLAVGSVPAASVKMDSAPSEAVSAGRDTSEVLNLGLSDPKRPTNNVIRLQIARRTL